MRKLSRPIMAATASLGVAAAAEKTEPNPATLYRPTNIVTARANIGRHAWAREIRDSRVERCRRLYEFTPDAFASLIPERTPLVSGHCPGCGAHFASAELLDRGAGLRCTGCRKTWACEDPDRSETWDVYGAMRSHRLRYVYLDIDSLGLAYVLTADDEYARRAAEGSTSMPIRRAGYCGKSIPGLWKRPTRTVVPQPSTTATSAGAGAVSTPRLPTTVSGTAGP